jgi:hypothetical protein
MRLQHLTSGLAAAIGLCSCVSLPSTLLPSWQQDANLIYQGTAAALAQQSSTPHLVARICYAEPEQRERLIQRLGDVPEPVRGLCILGDGTLALGVSDAISGQWVDTVQCGGQLLICGLPHQAYRIHVQNRTPQPLDLALGVDGKDFTTGLQASWTRSTLRVPAKKTLILSRRATPSGGELLFQPVKGDAALFTTTPRGTPGLIQIATWLAADAPSKPSQSLRPGQLPGASLVPLDAPEQYR